MLTLLVGTGIVRGCVKSNIDTCMGIKELCDEHNPCPPRFQRSVVTQQKNVCWAPRTWGVQLTQDTVIHMPACIPGTSNLGVGMSRQQQCTRVTAKWAKPKHDWLPSSLFHSISINWSDLTVSFPQYPDPQATQTLAAWLTGCSDTGTEQLHSLICFQGLGEEFSHILPVAWRYWPMLEMRGIPRSVYGHTPPPQPLKKKLYMYHRYWPSCPTASFFFF